MAIKIVDLPIIWMMIFHSYVNLPEGIKYPIWVNDNGSLTWIKAKAIWGWFPWNKPWFQGLGEQWGRYNLPRSGYD